MIDTSLNENQLTLISKQIDDLLLCLNQQSQKFFYGAWIGNLWILKRVLMISGYSLTLAQEQTVFFLCSQGLVKNILKQQVRSCAKSHALMEDIFLFFKKNSIDTDVDWESLKKNLLPNKPPAPGNDKKWKNLPRAQKIDNENSHLFYNLDKALLEWYEQQSGALSSHSQASLSLSASLALRLPLEAYEKKVGLHFLLSRHQVLMQYFFVAMADSGSLSAVTEIDWKSFSEQIVTISTPYFQFLSCCNPEMLQANQWQHNKWGNLDHEWKRLFTEMGTQSLVFFECVHTWNQAGKSFANPTEESSSETLTDGEKLLAVAKGIASIRESLNPHNAPPLMDELMVELERLVDLNRDILTLSCYTEPSTLMVDQRWRAQLAEARAPLISALQQDGSDVLNQQGQLSQHIEVLIQTIAADCTAGLGKAPCELVLYLLGSHSREDGTLYSDAEFALVYEPYENKTNEEVWGYLHTWLRLFQLAIFSLGETPLSGEAQSKFHIDTEVARKQWGICQEDMHSEMYNSVMLAFTLDEWHQYLHGRHMKDGSEVDARNQEIAAFRARLGDEDFFALLNADSVYQYSSLTSREIDNEETFSLSENQTLDTRFRYLLRSIAERTFESAITQKILTAELGGIFNGDLKLAQGQIVSLLKCQSILQRAFDTKTACSAQNQISLKLQDQNPLVFFTQTVKLWCPIKAKTTVGILQEAQQRGWLPIGFVELWKAALEEIARLRNRSSLVCGYQNDVIHLSELTPQEIKFLQGLEDGLLVPLQNELVQLTDMLRADVAQLETSHKTLYGLSWNVLMQFLTQRSQWCLQDEEHPWVNILPDYPDRCGFTPLGEKKLKHWQLHLISTYLTHERSPYIVSTPGLDEDKDYYLSQTLGDELFDLETGLPRTDFNNKFTSRTHHSTDRHAVHLIDDVFFKINAPTEKNFFNQTKNLPSEYEIFGRELAVQAIHYSLGGDSLAPGVLWRVEVQAARTCVYWVWLSQACEGEALTTVIKEKPNQLLQLTERSVSEHFLLAFVTAQLDGQPENFVLVLKGDEFELIGFDNGLAFGQCIKKQGSKLVVVLKSAVLLFPQMQSARFDPRTAEKIRLLDVPKWLSTIQAKIDNINQVWARILSPLSSGVAQNRAGIIIRLPEESSVWMSMVLNRFKTRLQRERIILYAKLFSDLNPQLKGLYQTFHEYNNLDEFSRLQFNELDPASYHTYKITTPEGPRVVSLSTVARAQDLRAYEDIIANMKATMHFTEQDFVSVNFKLLVDKHNNPDRRAQWLQLKLMEGTTFKILCLANCAVLTDERLEQFLNNMPNIKDLEVLDVSGCLNIVGTGWLDKLKANNPRVKIIPIRVSLLSYPYIRKAVAYATKYGDDFIEQLMRCEMGLESLDELCLDRILIMQEQRILNHYLSYSSEKLIKQIYYLGNNLARISLLPQNPTLWSGLLFLKCSSPKKAFINKSPEEEVPLENKLKICVVGYSSGGCGKTSLLRYLKNETFSNYEKMTCSCDLFLLNIQFNGSPYSCLFFEIAGYERDNYISQLYFRDAAFFIIVFSSDGLNILDETLKWYQHIIKNFCYPPDERPPIFILVRTKIDLVEMTSELQSIIDDLKEVIEPVAYVETSAKTGQGIEKLLEAITKAIKKYYLTVGYFYEERLDPTLVLSEPHLFGNEKIRLPRIHDKEEGSNLINYRRISEVWLSKLKENRVRWNNFIRLSRFLFPLNQGNLLDAVKDHNIATIEFFIEHDHNTILQKGVLLEFLKASNAEASKLVLNYCGPVFKDGVQNENDITRKSISTIIIAAAEKALRKSSSKGNVEDFNTLIATGLPIDINAASFGDKQTALHFACQLRNENCIFIIAELLKIGGNPTLVNNHGRTALDLYEKHFNRESEVHMALYARLKSIVTGQVMSEEEKQLVQISALNPNP